MASVLSKCSYSVPSTGEVLLFLSPLIKHLPNPLRTEMKENKYSLPLPLLPSNLRQHSLPTPSNPLAPPPIPRHLMRAGLRAVCFSTPSRFIIRDILREGFRDKKATFEPVAIERTILFLQAAQCKGFEHKLLKTLTRVSWDRRRMARLGWSWPTVMPEIRRKLGKRL